MSEGLNDILDYKTIDMNLHSSRGLNDLPTIFHGINISSFGDSHNNPFMRLKAVATDKTLPYEERVSAIRYMQRIPHVHMLRHTVPICFDIISDDRYPINERYFFFSNNDAITKLDPYIVRDCHEFFFKFTKDRDYPIILRLFSAKSIYYTYGHDTPVWSQARNFIKSLATDVQESVHIRSEAADCLYSRVDLDDYQIGYSVIRELGSLYSDNKMRTIYTNIQNVHDETITESVVNVIRNLLAEQVVIPGEHKEESREEITVGFTKFSKSPIKHIQITTDEIYHRLSEVMRDISKSVKNITSASGGLTNIDRSLDLESRVNRVYYKMIVNPSRYEGLTIVDILLLIWNKIQSHEHRIELERRLVEKLYEMDLTCSTGYITRLVNVLSGYVSDEKFTIRMNVKDQLRSNIFARLHANIELLPQSEREKLVIELSETGDKPFVKEFVEIYSVQDELQEEFKSLISAGEFTEIYDKCIQDFIGN